jgi:uncharacterized repeat protein (TIGR03803 family)
MTSNVNVIYNVVPSQGDQVGTISYNAAGDLIVTNLLGGEDQNGNQLNGGAVLEIDALPGGGYADSATVLGNLPVGELLSGSITMDAKGDLFAMTEDGALWEIPYSNGSYGALTEVIDNTGFPGAGKLVADSNGDLFGISQGTEIFELANTANGYTPIALASTPFDSGNLTIDAQGDLFGATQVADGNGGVVFELSTQTGTTTGYASAVMTIASFAPDDSPSTRVITDASGDLFVGAENTSDNNEEFYEIAKTNGVYQTPTLLATLNGEYVSGDGIAIDANGDIFATAKSNTGGPDSIVELLNTKNGYVPETLATFAQDGAAGTDLDTNLSFDAQGDLFGSTSQGGANGDGTVFEISASQIDPTISGVANQVTKSDAPIDPFSGVTISDPTDDYASAGTDVLTITQTGTGTLSGAGLTATATPGVYTLSGAAASITSELVALAFAPATGSSSTTSFALSYQSSLYASAVTAATSVEDLDAPTISDAAVTNGVVTAAEDTASQALTGTALADSTVSIYLDGAATPAYVTTAAANGDWSQTIGALSAGSYSYTATATDASGNVSAASSPLDFVVAPPPSPPSVSITSPAGGLVHQSQTVDVSTSVAAGDTVTGVEIYDGSTPLGAATENANGTWSANVTLPVGVDAITATATDAYNNVGTSAPVDYLAAPDADALITAKAWSLVTFANNPTAVDAAAGHVGIVGGNGGDLVFGGSDDAIALGNGADTVLGGSNEAIVLGGGNDTISVGSNTVIAAGNGNDSVTAGGDSVIGLGNGNDTVNAGADSSTTVGTGHNVLTAAAGDSWSLAANGYDTFQIDAGFGDNAIAGFNTSHDVLEFSTSLFANFSAVMNDAKQVGANTVITYDKSDVITLANVTASHLTAADFKFV